ncbi:uncharacterized protein JN550_005510 [Neoarthrinium moseri]|uniref:uncharacterized protein n=1 Tax=Neoarthrinium moseri TaxID=1658444 RepID=UPI001FDCF23B|nr:uncharacterized protein JN550_005510 [Neoarthrinium moseri]KAI1869920.1 hypothetical protein JN550_005510 [Neoarthrinium moseri]
MSAIDFFKAPKGPFHRSTYPFINPTRPELSTKGKTAIVTGSGQGIGLAIAKSLAKSGVSALGLIGRTEKTLLFTKESIKEISPDTKVFTYAVDVVDTKALTEALASFVATTGAKIDILAANAGYLPDLTSILDADADDWWSTFEINIKGNFNLLRAYQPHAARNGVVVHTSTSAIHIPYMPGYSAYRGSKAGATKVFEMFGGEMQELGNGKFGESVKGFPFDDVELSGDFVNWVVSDEAKFLNGKFVAANWDAEGMVQIKESIEKDPFIFTMNLVGWLELIGARGP